MTEECNWNLEKIKKEYEKYRKKYSLPSFEDMNKDFDIEKLQEKETDFILKEIRRAMSDRSVSYLRFVEMFQNPSQAPMFFLALVKNLDNMDKNILNELYLELGRFEIIAIGLDNDCDEKKDAEFINNFYKKWQNVKKNFGKIVDSLEKSWEVKSDKRDKGYLG